ncbi:MAG: insulinase family protein [Rhodocyclales bacterium]|nr:insulinase family protein [Rhodocyclales bacterium]
MKRLFKYCAVLLFSVVAAVLSAPTFADSTATPTIFETTLANGLRVIVKEDHRAPTVVHMVWYRVGSMDETDGRSGVAHALEHLMFKGTKRLPSGEFTKRVAAAGGQDNAFTSNDYTAYFQIVPKKALPEMMQMEADRMTNLVFTPAEFASEIKVVMEERRLRTDDNPQAQVFEAARSMAFMAHPYRRPIIGWMNDLENMTWQDTRQWYTQWYTPNNASVVVAGDVDHKEVFRLAEKYYGVHKAHALPVRKPQIEPEQKGMRRVVVKAEAKLPYVAMLWKVPRLRDAKKDREAYALEVLAAVLDGNDTSRLSKHLVRGEQVAQSAGAGYDGTVRGEATFIMEGQPAEGVPLAKLEAALRGEITRIQKEGVAPEELNRIKTQLVAKQIYKRDSLMAQAMEIGGVEAVGLSWRDVDFMVEQIKNVRAEEVQAVAKKYFNDDTLTVAVLDPQPVATASTPPRQQQTPATSRRH